MSDTPSHRAADPAPTEAVRTYTETPADKKPARDKKTTQDDDRAAGVKPSHKEET